jgi:hypothetical protein
VRSKLDAFLCHGPVSNPLSTSLLVPGKIALEILSRRDFLCGCHEQDAVITMARFRTLSACPNAMISAAQCRWARALLGWSITKLASSASVSASATDPARFRAGRRRISARRRRPPALRGAVRSRRRQRPRSHATDPQKARRLTVALTPSSPSKATLFRIVLLRVRQRPSMSCSGWERVICKSVRILDEDRGELNSRSR